MSGAFFSRFQEYFARPVAERAAHTLANGIEIEFQVVGSDGSQFETFTFGRENGKNVLKAGAAVKPGIVFSMTPLAADEILTQLHDEVSLAGVQILKLIFSSDTNRRVKVQPRGNFLNLWHQGYFGVLAEGGTEFAKYLASKGFEGMTAIKIALKKTKN